MREAYTHTVAMLASSILVAYVLFYNTESECILKAASSRTHATLSIGNYVRYDGTTM